MPTTLYGEFPQFDWMTGGELALAILEARLSSTDVQISTSRLIWGMEYADIGAAVGMDRSAVAKRLRDRSSRGWRWPFWAHGDTDDLFPCYYGSGGIFLCAEISRRCSTVSRAGGRNA